MEQAGLSFGLPPVGAGLNEAPQAAQPVHQPLTMADRSAQFAQLRSQGMSAKQASEMLGRTEVPPPLPETPETPSRLGMLPTAILQTGESLAFGAGDILSQMTGNDSFSEAGKQFGEAIGPTPEQEAASSQRFQNRADAEASGEIGPVERFAGDLGDALVSSAPQLGVSVGGGAAARAVSKFVLNRLPKPIRNVLEATGLEKKIVNTATAFGAAAPNAMIAQSDGYQRAIEEGLIGEDGVVPDEVQGRINQQTFWRTAFETLAPMSILMKHGGDAAIKRSVLSFGSAFKVGKTSLLEGLTEVADMGIQELFLDDELRAKLDEDDWTNLRPWLVDTYGRDALLSLGAGAALGGAFDIPGVARQQKLTNMRLAEDTRKAAAVLEPLGLGSAELEEMTKSVDGVKKLRQAVETLGKVERTRSAEMARIAKIQSPEIVEELKRDANRSMDERVDAVAKTLGAPKSLEDVRREREVIQARRTEDAKKRVETLGFRPAKDVDATVMEDVANRIDRANGQVQKLQARMGVAVNPERRAELQTELQSAREEQRQASIDARMKLNKMTSAQAVEDMQKADQKTAQKEGRERAITRITEAEFPVAMTPEARVARASEIITEAAASKRMDAGLDNKVKRLQRQRRAATKPEDIDRLTGEIDALEARRGLPTPAVEAAQRVLQAQGAPIPTVSEATRPADQTQVASGPEEAAAEGPAAVAEAAGPRRALDTTVEVPPLRAARSPQEEAAALSDIMDGRDVVDPETRARAQQIYRAQRNDGVPVDEAANVAMSALPATAPALRAVSSATGTSPGVTATSPGEVRSREVSGRSVGAPKSMDGATTKGAQRAAGPTGFDIEGGNTYRDISSEVVTDQGLAALEASLSEWTARTGFEAGAHVAADGTVLGVVTNDSPNALMPPQAGLNDPAVTFTHTHTLQTPFSAADAQAMLISGQPFRAILPDGQTLEIKPLVLYNGSEFFNLFRAVRSHLSETMPDGMPFLEQAKVKQEAMLQALEAAGYIEYSQPYDGLSDEQKDLINDTIDAAGGAISQAATRVRARDDGRAGSAQAGRQGQPAGQRRDIDEEDGEDGAAGEEAEDFGLVDPFNYRSSARKRKPSVDPVALRALAEEVHAQILAQKPKPGQRSMISEAVKSGELTVDQIETGIKTWVDNDGYKRMHAVLDVMRKMFPSVKFTMADTMTKTETKGINKGKKYLGFNTSDENGKSKYLTLALAVAGQVHLAKKGYIDAISIPIRARSGMTFRSGIVSVSPELKRSLAFTTPEFARFDPPHPAKSTSMLRRDARGNLFTDDALEPARRTAEYLQANVYKIDGAKVAALTPRSLISTKSLAQEGLRPEHVEQYLALRAMAPANWEPKNGASHPAGWTVEETKFMVKNGGKLNEKLVVAGKKLEQLRTAYRAFVEEHGADADVGFMYQVDNRGRIYADGQFNPQGGSEIKAIFTHNGMSLGDMIEVDASASGWQVTAMMARDHIAAPQVNLGRGQATQEGYKKADLYTSTIDKVVARIKADAAANVDTLPARERGLAAKQKEYAKKFVALGLGPDGKLTRNALKSSVIAVNYGGALPTFNQNIRKAFGEDADKMKGVEGAWGYIGGIAYDSLKETAPHSMALQKWAIDSIAALSRAMEPMYPPGKMPPVKLRVGLDGVVGVAKQKSKEAKDRIRDRVTPKWSIAPSGGYELDAEGQRIDRGERSDTEIKVTMKVDLEAANHERNARAVWANLVQGFDASILHRAVERYKRASDGAFVTTNHDSFTVPPGKEGLMAAAVRESMVEIMGQVDVPRRIYEDLMAQAAEHGVELNIQPFDNMGQYSLDDVMTSTPLFGEGPGRPDDFVPDYADLPEEGSDLRRGIDDEPRAVGGGVPAVGVAPARSPDNAARAPDTRSIQQLPPTLRRAVDVADYMSSIPESKGVIRDTIDAMQNFAADAKVGHRTYMDALEDTVFNGFAPIRRLELALNGRLADGAESAFKAAEMAVNDSGRQEALLYYGAAAFGKHGEYAVAPGTQGLKDIFKMAGGEGADRGQRLQDWMQWMVARRAQDLASRGIKTPLTPIDIQDALAKGAEIPEFQQAADAWKKFNDANLDFLEQSGRISAAQKDAMQADDFYVPFYRSDERVDGTSPELVLPQYRGGMAQSGVLRRDPGIKAIKGGDKLKIDDLMQNMIRNSQAIVAAGMRNKAANMSFDLMQQAQMARFEPISANKPDPNAIRMWRNGVESWVVPEGADAYPMMIALAGLQPVQLNTALKIMANIGSVFRQGITLTPPFMIRNAIRGAVSSGIMTTGANLTWTNNTVTGFRDAYNNGNATQAFKAQSGMGDFRFGNTDIGFGKNDLLIEFGMSPKTIGSRFRKFMDKLEHIGTASELADRIAARETMIKNGMRPDEASYQALTIMNYSRKGSSHALRAWLPLVPFMNARLQGLSRMAEGAVGKRGAAGRRQALGQMVVNGLVYTALGAAFWAANSMDEEDRERYKAEPLWRRLNYHIAYAGDTAIYIPKAFELGHIFTSIPELFGDAMVNDMNEIIPGLKEIVAQTVLMNMIPAAAMPAIEAMTNYSFFRQAELEGMRESGLRERDATSGASSIAKFIGQRLGVSDLTKVSPTMIEHYLSSYAGIYYVMTSTAFDIAAQEIGLSPAQSAEPFGDVPVASEILRRTFGSFLKDQPLQSTKFVDQFYQTMGYVTQSYRSAREARISGDIEYAQRLEARTPKAEEANKLLGRASRKLTDVNADIRRTRANPDLSRVERRNALARLIQQRNAITREAMTRVRELEAEQGITFKAAR